MIASICGSRHTPKAKAAEACRRLMVQAEMKFGPCTLLVSGLGGNADLAGVDWARARSIPVEEHAADWDRWGKDEAGRNTKWF